MSDNSLPVISNLNNLSHSEIRSLSTEFMSEFSDTYKKLGSFKDARKKHESRNVFSRWWNRKELKNSELDSIELQESMAQQMGKLTVLQMYAQNEIAEQQTRLGHQQQVLETQTNEIAEANEKIASQQGELSKQQMELKDLVESYFELKGLTAEQGAQLIKCAKEIEAAKSGVEHALKQQQQEFVQQIEKLQTAQADGQRWVSEQMDRAMADARSLLVRSETQVHEQLLRQDGQIKISLQEQQQMFQQQSMQQAEQMRIAQENVNTLLEHQKIEVQQAMDGQAEQLQEHSLRIEQDVARYNEKISQSQAILRKSVSRWGWFSVAGSAVAIAAFVLVFVI